MKFVPPVVANGRVYLPNHDNQVAVYGLLPARFYSRRHPRPALIPPGGSGTFSVTIDAIGRFAEGVDLSASGPAVGQRRCHSLRSRLTGPGVTTMTVAVSSDTAGQHLVDGHRHERRATCTRHECRREREYDIRRPRTQSASISLAVTRRRWVRLRAQVSSHSPTGTTRPARRAPHPWSDANRRHDQRDRHVVGQQHLDNAGHRPGRKPADDEGVSRYEEHVDDDRDGRELVPRAYDVYVYADGDNRTYDVPAVYTIAGRDHRRPRSRSPMPRTRISGDLHAGDQLQRATTRSSASPAANSRSPQRRRAGRGTRRAPINASSDCPVRSASGAISVSFVGTSAIGMGPSETAGVVSKANWNNAAGAVACAAPTDRRGGHHHERNVGLARQQHVGDADRRSIGEPADDERLSRHEQHQRDDDQRHGSGQP